MSIPYVKNRQIFQCPSYRPPNPIWDGQPFDAGYYAGYAVNMVHWGIGNAVPMGQSLAAAGDSASIIILGESDDGNIASLSAGIDPAVHGGKRTGAGSTRHNDMSNYGYLDGHVKTVKGTAIPCASDTNCHWSMRNQM